MFLLLRLILGHLTADFVLQPDEIYIAKKKSLRGASIHYLIIFLTFLFFCFPYLRFPGCWLVITFAVFTHIIQDEIKLRISISPKINFIAFVFDQIFHIACLCPILFFKFAYSSVSSVSMFARVYNNDSLIIFIITYIISLFTGIYLWEGLKISYLKKSCLLENTALFNTYIVKYGMFERFIITTSFLHAHFLLFLPLPFIFRILSKRLSFSLDLVFNLLYASLLGLFLRQYLPIS